MSVIPSTTALAAAKAASPAAQKRREWAGRQARLAQQAGNGQLASYYRAMAR